MTKIKINVFRMNDLKLIFEFDKESGNFSQISRKEDPILNNLIDKNPDSSQIKKFLKGRVNKRNASNLQLLQEKARTLEVPLLITLLCESNGEKIIDNISITIEKGS